MTQEAESPQQGDWLVEQRYRAVLEVLDGSPITEVAQRYGVSRQSVYTWKAKYAAGGFEGLREASRRPRTSPTRLPGEVEALVCEMRRSHPRWGARRIAYEIERTDAESAPSRATVHRVLARNGLVRPQEQQHRRKYKRWQRETPMHLWQLDLVGGIYLADGRECKMLTGIDDHSRFIVVAEVLSVPSGRAVADAFVRAMRIHGVPAEVLTDNGKQFTGRYTRPRPAEVLFERVCRENGIGAKLTKPYSPTTTGKIERWHRTLRRELLDDCGPFASLAAAQAAINEWVHTYNHLRPHQALDMATPASLFRPNPQPEPVKVVPAQRSEAVSGTAEPAPPALILEPSAGAVEFDTVLPASGQVSIIPSVQRIRLGAGRAGLRARIWADENTVHVLVNGEVVKSVPSNLDAEHLHQLKLRGARPAGPPPAPPAVDRVGDLPSHQALEVERTVDPNGWINLAGQRVKIGSELANRRITVRLDGHLLHAVHDGLLAKTLPSPFTAGERPRLVGARVAATQLPPAPAAVSVERKVPTDGVVMVARQRLRVGRTYAGRIVTVYVEDTHFRVTYEGAEISLHARKDQHPVTRWKAKIHAPKL
ncbi:IS481 family transposase [Streptomyces mirabilis]|uniref:IS481 family transposase n=1 Tax=Streptomyces mirabilis TaxID=68239 RepID=UPI002E24B0F9|nr:IS481 family transposase [Streptomyces mirabilis]